MMPITVDDMSIDGDALRSCINKIFPTNNPGESTPPHGIFVHERKESMEGL